MQANPHSKKNLRIWRQLKLHLLPSFHPGNDRELPGLGLKDSAPQGNGNSVKYWLLGSRHTALPRKNFRLLLDQGTNTRGAQDLWWGALQQETQKPAQHVSPSPSPAYRSGC